ncbi:MAG TPA: ankyrin repeat domain-containing protein [Terriglobales bacterium]|nr:ankyrin repeat domain-containing protein [Terriglobales bacterium]
MNRTVVALTCLLASLCLWASDEKRPAYPSYDYDVARTHEIEPHRRTIPVEGVRSGSNQLRLTLTVSPTGDVLESDAAGDPGIMKLWPQLQGEVRRWKFTPFEANGKAVTAEVEEYIDLVPPERLPKSHVAAPALRRDSKVAITLERSGCFGTCPSYTVTVSTDGIVFKGRSGFVVASGTHTDTMDAAEVRKLAKRFVAADFYSMDPSYRASVTDNPSYVLSIEIDGHTKKVEDYVGSWEGMPAVVTELENAVDTVARTERWIEGGDGLVEALQAEKFNFKSFEAQVMLKEAASRGTTATVRELLEAGVPLVPIPAPKPKGQHEGVPFEAVGWLNAASRHLETLQTLIDAGASNNDQGDKDLALVGAARSGSVEAVRALVAYGANPNADLSKMTVTRSSGGMTLGEQGAGSILIYAAESGNPDMLREVLRYSPKLEARDREGKTAIFAAGESGYRDRDGARAECVRLIAQAGANVNARDKDGNTPLHETYLTEVQEELLKLGADVNARNKDGETPIFTTVDDSAIPLFIEHGADLTIRNNKGQTVVDAANAKGPQRQEVLRKAIENLNQR